MDDGEYEREDESGLEVESVMEDSDVCVGQQPPPRKFRSFRGLDKGYRFLRDGHVQKIRLSPVLRSENDGDHVYVTCTVLPSMRKDRLYDVREFVARCRPTQACHRTSEQLIVSVLLGWQDPAITLLHYCMLWKIL